MAPVLPKQKQKILFFLKHYIERQGFAPTLTEIAKEFGVSSLATVHEHLQALTKKGIVKKFAKLFNLL